MENNSKKDGIYYLIGGIAGGAFLIGAYHGNKIPMNNLWDAQSIISILFFVSFILIGISKLIKIRK